MTNDDCAYAGAWQNDLKHGKGIVKYKNNNVYEGYFLNDVQEGYGEYQWKRTGAVYKGEWRNGKKHGKGTWTCGL